MFVSFVPYLLSLRVGYFSFLSLSLSHVSLSLFIGQADFERRADPKSSEAAALLEEMRAHVKRVS